MTSPGYPHHRYEVYDKRALHEDRAGLPLLDRTTRLKRARKMANAWGGVVLRLTTDAEGATTVEVVHVHQATPPSARQRDEDVVTLSELRRKLYGDAERPRTKFRRPF